MVARQRPGLRAQQRQPPGPEHPRRDPLPAAQLPPPADARPLTLKGSDPLRLVGFSGRGRGGDRGRLPCSNAGGRGRGTRRAGRGPSRRRRSTSSRSEIAATGSSPRRSLASRTMRSTSEPTKGARSVLLIVSRSARAMPGPPLRGMSSPAATSITKICTSASAGEKIAVRLSPPLSTKTTSSGPGRRLQLLDGLEVGGDVVADRGVRAAAGLHRGDPLDRQHAGGAQELGVLGRVDVVGDDAEAGLGRQRAAERGDQAALAGADGAADADPECAFNWQRVALSVRGGWGRRARSRPRRARAAGRRRPRSPARRAPAPAPAPRASAR